MSIEQMKKYRYDDAYSPIVEEIMSKADKILKSFWDEELQKNKIKSPYEFELHIYERLINELVLRFIDFMKWGEDYFLKNTIKDDEYPPGCIYRANRALALWQRWDWKYRGIIPSYKFYS